MKQSTKIKVQRSKPIDNDKIIFRLNRIGGQVAAVKRMYEEERGCDKIIQQILAAREALGATAKILLKDEAVRCVRKPKDLEKSLEKIIKFT